MFFFFRVKGDGWLHFTGKCLANIAILRTREVGAYQRLLTSKYFLRNMRKQNASMLLVQLYDRERDKEELNER